MPACVPKGWMSACGVLALRKFRLCLRTICPYSFCASFAFRLRGFQFAGSRHIMQDMQAYASICKHMQSMRTSSPSAFKNVLETAASSMSCLRPWWKFVVSSGNTELVPPHVMVPVMLAHQDFHQPRLAPVLFGENTWTTFR